MNPASLTLVSLSILICFSFSCTTHSDAQLTQTANKAHANAATVREDNEALVKIEHADPETISNLESLLALPPPRITLTFSCTKQEMEANSCGNNLAIDLPANLDVDIAAYWKESLRFTFRDQVEKFPNAQTNYDESIRFSNLGQRLEEKLRSTRIPTDKGERAISSDEADQIIANINRRTAELVKKIKAASPQQ